MSQPQPIHFHTPGERPIALLPWSDRDLDQMSQISESDIRRADAYWKRYLPKRLRGLLDAKSTIPLD